MIKDSGQRRQFDTGSVRDVRKGKGRFDLFMIGFRYAIRALSHHLEEGAEKYGDSNWRLGQPLSVYIDSAFRHFTDVVDGATNEPHDVAFVWNAMAFLETKLMIDRGELPATLNDLPGYDASSMRKELLKQEPSTIPKRYAYNRGGFGDGTLYVEIDDVNEKCILRPQNSYFSYKEACELLLKDPSDSDYGWSVISQEEKEALDKGILCLEGFKWTGEFRVPKENEWFVRNVTYRNRFLDTELCKPMQNKTDFLNDDYKMRYINARYVLKEKT